MTAADDASEVTIRPGRPEDAEDMHRAIFAMGRGLGMQAKITSTVEDFRRCGFGPEAAFGSFVAEAGGELVGLCLYFPIFSTWRGRPGVFVQDLYVDEGLRGQGIGERMLREAASWSKARGGDYLRLTVDAENFAAQRFYERLGITWQKADHEHAAYGDAFRALAEGLND
ncbi:MULTISPECIES: GNAT family N-acetyltransferase [unclassified Ensifer]|uniref:GNAT family N-acetyltransferase n=1 Tax=unclassified Ensifer TaxID=2633371 RepID=UPI00081317F1|nr:MULTISPECIES: GNAT family N-acetyltransferase [unclassified Ensifer]OCP00586.1 acetyltransferase [Ensifer sp. LC14]OCP07857.1 acetyltransferase [Ensifer sp. LC11]OCP08628.1 acetyltransferase [Ensifer sp. LC13]OCP32080.1 acetyltransferase [Ensifer sp. LC499]